MYPSGDILARFASIGPPVVVVFRKSGVVMNGWERRFQSGERASKGNYAVGVKTMNYFRVRAAFARDQTIVLVDYVTSNLPSFIRIMYSVGFTQITVTKK